MWLRLLTERPFATVFLAAFTLFRSNTISLLLISGSTYHSSNSLFFNICCLIPWLHCLHRLERLRVSNSRREWQPRKNRNHQHRWRHQLRKRRVRLRRRDLKRGSAWKPSYTITWCHHYFWFFLLLSFRFWHWKPSLAFRLNGTGINRLCFQCHCLHIQLTMKWRWFFVSEFLEMPTRGKSSPFFSAGLW